jgi:hypothetical protein
VLIDTEIVDVRSHEAVADEYVQPVMLYDELVEEIWNAAMSAIHSCRPLGSNTKPSGSGMSRVPCHASNPGSVVIVCPSVVGTPEPIVATPR